jgi:uncharacterized protein YdeI (YjbR/CyaY-like superfamily)
VYATHLGGAGKVIFDISRLCSCLKILLLHGNGVFEAKMQKHFQARLEPVRISLPWTIIRLPFDPVEAWPNRVKLRVKGSLRVAGGSSEPYSFATSLQRSHELGYMMLVTEKMRKATGLAAGSVAEVVLEADIDGQSATPPPELVKLLRADRAVKKWFESLNYSTRKFLADDIQTPKSAEVRVRRAEQWVERMMMTMEGEESPPPILQAAFRRQPLAQAGWEALTPNQRRLALFSLSMCASPEAQAKRIERVVADAPKAARRIKTATRPTNKPLDERPNRRANRRAKGASNDAE